MSLFLTFFFVIKFGKQFDKWRTENNNNNTNKYKLWHNYQLNHWQTELL